jgi:propanol-preferring alcohol dehydrogenase
MKAWAVDVPGPVDRHPLRLVDKPLPQPGLGQVRVKVQACGVCRTDLHLAEGDLAPKRHLVTPGHEVVGVVDALGQGTARFKTGDRAGVAWLGGTCGTCRYCLSGRENLCMSPTFTGWDTDGGYAPFALVDERYAYALPGTLAPEKAAPLLCSGIIGYRAWLRAHLPPGGRLGIYGFGGSGHLMAQVALAKGARVHVVTRSPAARQLALDLGAASATAVGPPPEPLDAAVLFAPSGDLVPVALEALDRGGALVVAGIHLSAIPPLDYDRHLFQERSLCSVTANTRADGEEFLALAAQERFQVITTPYALEEADQALADLATGRVKGAGVLLLDN